MPDNDTPQTPPAGDGGTPPAGEGGAAPAAGGTGEPANGGPSGGDEAISLEEARKLRKENEQLRKRAKAAEEASLSEQEKKDKELEELRAARTGWEAEKRDLRLRESVTEAARELNFVNPTLAHRLIDRGAVNYDETSGSPTNIDVLLKALIKSDPYLANASAGGSWGGGARGGATSGGSSDPGSDMTARIRAATGRT